jgi:hypothetical protein
MLYILDTQALDIASTRILTERVRGHTDSGECLDGLQLYVTISMYFTDADQITHQHYYNQLSSASQCLLHVLQLNGGKICCKMFSSDM